MANPFTPFTSWLATRSAGLWRRYGGVGVGLRVRLLHQGSRIDYEREAGDTWTNSVVALGLQWLEDRWTKPPVRLCKISRSGDHVPLGRHEFLDLWARPNPYDTRRNLETAIGLDLKTDGNAYLLKVRSRAGKVVQLWWVPSFLVDPQWPADGSEFLSGYAIRRDGDVYYVPREDMIHFRLGRDPRNERRGLSALKSQLREICTDNEASTYTASLLRNSAVPGLMVVPDSETLRPNRDDAEQIKERIRDSFTGDSRGDSIVLLGKYKVQPVGFSPEQLQLRDLPNRAMSRIAAAMGVAAMSLGLDDPNKTYSNLAEANRASWSTITALQTVVAEALRWQLLSEFVDPYSHVVEYDYTAIDELNEDLDRKHTRVREDWKAGLLTQANAQELLGYDVDPEGDRYYPGTGGDDPEAPALPIGQRPGGAVEPDGDEAEDEDEDEGEEPEDDPPPSKRFTLPGY